MVDAHKKLYKEKKKKKDISVRGKLKNLMLYTKCKKNFKDFIFVLFAKNIHAKTVLINYIIFPKKIMYHVLIVTKW